MVDSRPYQSVKFKASHNSYERDERPVTVQLAWTRREGHRHQGGCRGLEIDLRESPNLFAWSVHHDEYQGRADAQFTEYLRHLRAWSSFEGRHDVITIILDLKARATIAASSRAGSTRPSTSSSAGSASSPRQRCRGRPRRWWPVRWPPAGPAWRSSAGGSSSCCRATSRRRRATQGPPGVGSASLISGSTRGTSSRARRPGTECSSTSTRPKTGPGATGCKGSHDNPGS